MGGASNGGFFENLILQLLAICVVFFALLKRSEGGANRTERRYLWLHLMLVLIVAIQFLPLPFPLWASLPGRSEIAEELALVGVVPEATFLTLSYHESMTSFTWLLPALGLSLALAVSAKIEKSWFAGLLICVALAALGLGLVQFLGDQNSPAYLYSVTNRGLMVGFFANANHMATLLLVTLPFLAALTRLAIERRPQQEQELTALALVLLGFLVLGIGLVGSLTGYALALPVIALSGAIMFPRLTKALKLAIVPAIALGGAIFVFTEEGGNVFAEESTDAQHGREEIFRTTYEATTAYWPAGTGLGTFREIYDNFEDPDAASPKFVNHAHNDYLEIALEFGLLGVLGIAVFLAWWLSTLRSIWRARIADPFVQAAAIGSGVILLHSAWDYPLRTAALGAVFALCCAILARALPPIGSSVEVKSRVEASA